MVSKNSDKSEQDKKDKKKLSGTLSLSIDASKLNNIKKTGGKLGVNIIKGSGSLEQKWQSKGIEEDTVETNTTEPEPVEEKPQGDNKVELSKQEQERRRKAVEGAVTQDNTPSVSRSIVPEDALDYNLPTEPKDDPQENVEPEAKEGSTYKAQLVPEEVASSKAKPKRKYKVSESSSTDEMALEDDSSKNKPSKVFKDRSDKTDWQQKYIEEKQELSFSSEPEKLAVQVRKSNNTRVMRKGKTKKDKQRIYQKPESVTLDISGPTILSELALLMNQRIVHLIGYFFKNGKKYKASDLLSLEEILELGEHFGHEINLTEVVSCKDTIEEIFFNTMLSASDVLPRGPIVTVMGHVDHGKTSLLDTIRDSAVVKKESGGITQHIGAYQVAVNDKYITFIDTPGHSVFTEMRLRGANVTDIVILVIAADDGVREQTIESINHAQSANAQIIVAITKIDKGANNVNKIKADLMQYNIITEDMGGDTLVCEVSSHTKQGVPELLDAILLQADMMKLETIEEGPAKATVLEASIKQGFGVVATIIVNQGLLKVGQDFVCGSVVGKVRRLMNVNGDLISQVERVSQPVMMVGFEDTPQAGEVVYALDDIDLMKQYQQEVIKNSDNIANDELDVDERLKLHLKKQSILKIILKADTYGSLQSIMSILNAFDYTDVKVEIAFSAIGSVNETDVKNAQIAKAHILAFNTSIPDNIAFMAKSTDVAIYYYDIIYNLIDKVKVLLQDLLDPIVENVHIGYVDVREVFKISSLGVVAGCYVTEGKVLSDSYVIARRGKEIIYEGKIEQLKRVKDNVKEVNSGYECGILFPKSYIPEVGDVVESFEVTVKKAQLG